MVIEDEQPPTTGRRSHERCSEVLFPSTRYYFRIAMTLTFAVREFSSRRHLFGGLFAVRLCYKYDIMTEQGMVEWKTQQCPFKRHKSRPIYVAVDIQNSMSILRYLRKAISPIFRSSVP